MATRVRVNCDCDDISVSLFARSVSCGAMNRDNQGACQSRKTAKNRSASMPLADFPNQELAANPKDQLGTFTMGGASTPCVSL